MYLNTSFTIISDHILAIVIKTENYAATIKEMARGQKTSKRKKGTVYALVLSTLLWYVYTFLAIKRNCDVLTYDGKCWLKRRT
jgi:hypothetical protein